MIVINVENETKENGLNFFPIIKHLVKEIMVK